MIKLKSFLIEQKENISEGKTPKGHINETVKLYNKVQKQLDDLTDTVIELKQKANQGTWYFSGQMLNDYGITKVEEIKNMYSDLKDDVDGSLLWELKRDVKQYMDRIGKKIESLKKAKIPRK